jgi:hypothetical protein
MSKKQLSYTLWVEKYRPSSVVQVLLPPDVKNFFNKLVEEKEIPNLLLYSSSPGVGKCLTGDNEVEVELDECIYNKFKDLFND